MNDNELISHLYHDEFLPPISNWMKAGGLVLVSTIAIAVGVCAVTPLPVTVKAQGIVRPDGDTKIVQASTEGVVTSISSKVNQIVEEGDTIAILNDSRLETKKEQLKANIDQNLLQIKILEEQIQHIKNQILAEENRLDRSIISAKADLQRIKADYQERRLITQAQVAEARANLRVNQRELEKNQAELRAIKSNIPGQESSLKILQEKLERYEEIAGEGVISRDRIAEVQLQVTQSEQQLNESRANLETQRKNIERQEEAIKASQATLNQALASLNPSDAPLQIGEEKIAQEEAIRNSTLAQLNRELNSFNQRKIEIEQQIANNQEEILQIELEQDKTVISATATGVILTSNLRNISQSVKNGDEIAQIAPLDTPLIITTRVAPQDRGKLELNQKAQMRVSAFSYPDYGLLNGTVISISPDVIIPLQNNNTSQSAYFEVKIEPDVLYLNNHPENQLRSGMEVTADIIAKEETILKYILRKARLWVDG